jgi:Bifunctional DNA primase/polymerase, N-terminal
VNILARVWAHSHSQRGELFPTSFTTLLSAGLLSLVWLRSPANGTVERSMPMTSALLDTALTHVAHGHAVIAVTKNKTPYHKGWNGYFTRRQSEEEANREFSNGAHGIAMVLWPACPYVVLDFDGPHADKAWQKMGVELPATARNRTQSGGIHIFFKIPPKLKFEIKRKIRLVKATCSCPKTCGVDLLVHGYAVLPPTPGYAEDPDYCCCYTIGNSRLGASEAFNSKTLDRRLGRPC